MTTLRGLNDDFRDLLSAFARERVDFLIVGAYALALHGLPRATGDLDVLIRPTPENASRVWRALERFGAPLDATGVEESDFATPGLVYQIGLPPRRIDVLTEITGVSFDSAWETRQSADLDGDTVHFLSKDAFIRNKQALGRPRDLADVERLKR